MAAPGRPGRDLGCPMLPLGRAPRRWRGAALLGGARGGLSHVQALGSPICGAGVEQHRDVGHRVLQGCVVGCRTLVPGARANFPPSLLCGCWAQPLGLVKQQDRSRLGKRGTGESLNKEFLIWDGLGSVACFLPHPAVRGSAPCPTSAWQRPCLGGFPSKGGSGHPFWGSLHGPGLSLCT